jgi:Domain of unknown function (DUF4232)
MSTIRRRMRWLLPVAAGVVAVSLAACHSSAGPAPAAPSAAPGTTAGVPASPVAGPAPAGGPGDPGHAGGPGGPGSGAASGQPRCHTAVLRASFGRPDAATGHLGVELVLTNQSSRTCRVYGYGGIQLLDAAGAALPTRQVRISSPTPRLVQLVPGTSVHSGLLWPATPEAGGCEQPAFLLVTPPDETASIRVRFPFGAVCERGRIQQTPYQAGSQDTGVSTAPIPVPLGTHRFGRLTPFQSVVAKAGPRDVGFSTPPPGADGVEMGPWSFKISTDGAVWLLDEVNSRLLVWRRGNPDRVARVVPLPVLAVDFAVGPDGAVYITTPDRASKGMALVALSPAGAVRWRALLADEIFNRPLRWGPDGRLYEVADVDRWIPILAGGRPLAVAEQRRGTLRYQPLAHGRRLLTSRVSPREVRYTLVDAAGQRLRAWRVTSTTEITAGLSAVPGNVGGDPVVTLDVTRQDPGRYQWEFLVLRLSPTGGTVQVTARRNDYGQRSFPELQVGPDGALYQLRISPATGALILRYPL